MATLGSSEKGVQNVSAGRVAHDCTRFRRAAGGNPTHVFVRSAAWDYARWWYFEGNQSKNSPTAWCHGGLIDRWRNALAAFLKIVRSTFHTAALFIRTDAFDHRAYIGKTAYFVSPDCVGGMNQASREVAHQLGIGILDLASTIQTPATKDGIHFDDGQLQARQQMYAIWALILSVLQAASGSTQFA